MSDQAPVSSNSANPPPRENLFLNLACNIVLPIVILNKLSTPMGPAPALLLALAFPFFYGMWDYLQKKKANFFSILGLLNTLITGGLALIGVSGLGFAIKEAAFPALIGLFVLGSAWTRKPAVKSLFLNPSLFHLDRIEGKVQEHGRQNQFDHLLRNGTKWLAASFFLSALLNFELARRIFLPMPENMDELARSTLLNDQIADMHKWSFLVIMVPSMIFLMAIFFVILRGLKNLTGLQDEDIYRTK